MRIDPIAKASALLTACAALVVPASAAAQKSGGLGYGEEAAPSLQVRTATMLNRTLNISGSVADAQNGEAIVVQRLLADRRWETIATTSAALDGSFKTIWRANRAGRHTLRAVTASGASATATAAATQATGRVTVYRSAIATWFGPGFYGKKTACGQKLTKQTVGVAHKTLPCGTQVELYYKGRAITVPVIDRGPYAEGRTWDLTKAAADLLGFSATGRLGAVRL